MLKMNSTTTVIVRIRRRGFAPSSRTGRVRGRRGGLLPVAGEVPRWVTRRVSAARPAERLVRAVSPDLGCAVRLFAVLGFAVLGVAVRVVVPPCAEGRR
jgi:hypothetical protein